MKDDRHYIRMHRVCQFFIKWFVVAMFISMMVHVVTLIMGYDLHFAYMVCSHSLLTFILLMASSYAYGFCKLHRAMIVYDYVVSLCCDYQDMKGFDTMLWPMRSIMLVSGIVILYFLIIKGIHTNHVKE